MMPDKEEGSTMRADVTTSFMLGLRLPEVVFGRERKLLRRRWNGRRDLGLRGRQQEWRRCGQRETVALRDRNPALVEIALSVRVRRVMARIAEGCACRNQYA